MKIKRKRKVWSYGNKDLKYELIESKLLRVLIFEALRNQFIMFLTYSI